MIKLVYQSIITILFFCIAWFGLSKIDIVNLFKVKDLTDETEEKIGNIIFDIFQNSNEEINNPFVINTIDSIISKICIKNDIKKEKIKLKILKNDEINAFALPSGYLVIYSGLIENTDNQQELSGVIAHEIAHIELQHVMKKLINEFGLSVLISMTTDLGNGTEIIKEITKLLSSSSYSRKLEKEADLKAVDYLLKTNIDPEPFANFLYNLSEQNHENNMHISWISTHPESRERAKYIIYRIKEEEQKNKNFSNLISNKSWDKLIKTLKEN